MKRAQQSTPVFLPGKPHEQRSLAGYSPLGCTESDMTEESLHARILNSILEQKETSGNVGEAQIKSVI